MNPESPAPSQAFAQGSGLICPVPLQVDGAQLSRLATEAVQGKSWEQSIEGLQAIAAAFVRIHALPKAALDSPFNQACLKILRAEAVVWGARRFQILVGMRKAGMLT